MFGRIVDIAANGADVFAGRSLEDDFADGDDGRRIVEIGERIKVSLDLCADEDRSVRICRRIGIFGGKPRIDENDLATSVNNPVLETGTT